jgi:hypothetical protein
MSFSAGTHSSVARDLGDVEKIPSIFRFRKEGKDKSC